MDELETLPENERTAEIDCELARAYNNLGNSQDIEGRKLLRKALRLLEKHEEELSDDYSWNFRMGYALIFLEREGEALPYFEKALELYPGDDPKYNTRGEIQTLIDSCRENMALPMFVMTFSTRVALAWEEFEREEAEIRRMMDSDRRDDYSEELIQKIQDILEIALDDPTFEFGIDEGKHDLVLVTQGDKTRLFEYVYFRDHAPESVLENWKITVGRPPRPEFHLRVFDIDVCGDDVDVWVERTEEDRVSLKVHCDKVQGSMEDEDKIWWMLFTVVDNIIGEIANMRQVESFEVVDDLPEGRPIRLSDLPKAMEDLGIVLTNDADSYLKRYTVYKTEPNRESEGPWRLDIMSGSNCCPPIINDYYSGERRCVNTLHADGAVAGYIAYSLDTFDGEDRSDRIFDFRDSLEEALTDKAGENSFTVIGGATGLYYGYLDLIAWDLSSVLPAAQEFLTDSGVSEAFFRVFAMDVPTCLIANNKDGDSLLGPMEIATLESFIGENSGQFGRALVYLLDFIDRGISEGRFTEEQARVDLQIALWYSYACINMHQYDYYYMASEWMPSSMCNASGCGTWFYRYACSLMFCGRLEKALQMAEKGTKEEPDYPWAWLLLGELRAHFGDVDGALQAVDRGLEIVPGDYEFETLRGEINDGATLEVMLRHWIDPDLDAELQAGKVDDDSEALDMSIRCVVLDDAGIERFMDIFGPEPNDWSADDPYCSFNRDMEGHGVQIVFRMNRAGLSKMDTEFLENLRGWFDEGRWLRYPFGDSDNPSDIFLDTVMVSIDGSAVLSYPNPEGGDNIVLGLDPWGHPMPPEMPEMYDEGQWDAVERHIADHFGDFPNVYHELVSPDIHVDICIVPPRRDHDYYTLVTMGMGAHEMDIPDGVEDARRRAEVMINLPRDWRLDEDSLQDSRWYWPIRMLKDVARLPINTGCWLGWGHTVGMDGEGTYDDSTGLCGCILLSPGVFGDGSYVCDLPDGERVEFFQIIPLYREEIEYKIENGAEGLLDISNDDLLEVIDPCRFNIVSDYDRMEHDDAIMDAAGKHQSIIDRLGLNVDALAAYNHMAIYLRWCILNGKVNRGFVDRHRDLVSQVASGDVTDLRAFVRDDPDLDGKLTTMHLNPIGSWFTQWYNWGDRSNPYEYLRDVKDYADRFFAGREWGSEEEMFYAYLQVPWSEGYCNDMMGVIDGRFGQWLESDPSVSPDYEDDGRPDPEGWEGARDCIISERASSGDVPIGFCIRREPEREDQGWDSGWRFFADDDDDTDEGRIMFRSLWSVCDSDPDIRRILMLPYGTAFVRGDDGMFHPYEEDDQTEP